MDRWIEPFLVFTLIGFRIVGFMGFATFLGSRNIPVVAKMVFAVALSMLMFPLVYRPGTWVPDTLGEFAACAGVETAAGVIFGFMSSLLFTGIQLGGYLIGNKMGFSMANAVDPFTEAEVTLIEEFKFFLAVFIFLLLGGHHLMVRGLCGTYQMVPVGRVSLGPRLWTELSGQFAGVFLAALQTAAPVAGAMFLVTLGMGFLSRAVPQVNVMMISFPVQITVGLVLIVFFMPIVVVSVARALALFAWNMDAVTKLLVP